MKKIKVLCSIAVIYIIGTESVAVIIDSLITQY